jgi:ELWxxDGT repeat protein
MVFAASNGRDGVELWQMNPTIGQIGQVADIATGPSSSNPVGFTLSGAKLFFAADNGKTGLELWTVNRADLGVFQNAPTTNPGRVHLPLVRK